MPVKIGSAKVNLHNENTKKFIKNFYGGVVIN